MPIPAPPPANDPFERRLAALLWLRIVVEPTDEEEREDEVEPVAPLRDPPVQNDHPTANVAQPTGGDGDGDIEDDEDIEDGGDGGPVVAPGQAVQPRADILMALEWVRDNVVGDHQQDPIVQQDNSIANVAQPTGDDDDDDNDGTPVFRTQEEIDRHVAQRMAVEMARINAENERADNDLREEVARQKKEYRVRLRAQVKAQSRAQRRAASRARFAQLAELKPAAKRKRVAQKEEQEDEDCQPIKQSRFAVNVMF